METKSFSVLALVLLALVGSSLCASPAENNALVDIYNSLDGPNWRSNRNWLVGDPCAARWSGVSCSSASASGHVEGLILEKNRLSGTIPNSIVNLPLLTNWSFHSNAVSGPIPPTVAELRYLSKIDLGVNQLNGTIPNSLENLVSFFLTFLDLSHNQLSGHVPSFFSGAQDSFTFCDLAYNDFICPLPPNIEYTNASCLGATLTDIDTNCVSPAENTRVYGKGFLTGNLSCTFIDHNQASRFVTPFHAIDDTYGICLTQQYVHFSDCTGQVGSRMLEVLQLGLSYSSTVVSNTLPVNLLNTACDFGHHFRATTNGMPVSGAFISLPPFEFALEICALGNPTPYGCPGYSEEDGDSDGMLVEASFSPLCDYNCHWAPISNDKGPVPSWDYAGYCLFKAQNSQCSLYGTGSSYRCSDVISEPLSVWRTFAGTMHKLMRKNKI